VSSEASFEVAVGPEAATAFATLSGDWNPLHTDAEYARQTAYGRTVLHGAFSAGLISRMAGMYLPGTECLLHDMRLRFIAPILPPVRLRVAGRVVSDNGQIGRVEASVTDAVSAQRYVDAGYEFGRHDKNAAGAQTRPGATTESDLRSDEPVIVITGATGALGAALLSELGARAVGVSRQPRAGLLHAPDLEQVASAVAGRQVSAIVHCGWPSPDNSRLIALDDARSAVEHYVGAPLRQCLALAKLLVERGTPDALLVLVGSTASAPGRHNFRMPLYSLGKSLLPTLSQILAVELGASGRRVATVVFDVLDAGMNQRLSRLARQAHADRSPTGQLPGAAEAAAQLAWVMANRSFLMSGATLTLSGGSLP
jgi:3-hydroxybutyryl-CoA dehydratase